MKRSQLAARYGLLVALALILSYVEAQIPAFFTVPGMKLGLTNVVVLFALYSLGEGGAVAINLLRIVLVSVLFGNGMSMAYSVAGGLLSGAVMILLKKTGQFSIPAVSVAGGVSHNVGQILAAMVLLGTRSIAWYLLVLWFTGIASGLVIGLLGAEIIRRMKPILKE